MTAVYCSQGHLNLSGSRFCCLCGERLAILGPSQVMLGDRYRLIHELGHGGFGRTYLAEDINRFNERCVLKEFAPQVQGSFALQKSEELFAREAGVLYRLYHPQIPRFRELFRATLAGQDRLFLVQDYIEGQTYRQLLDIRRAQGFFFSEWEIQQFLEQLLPVLHYIHEVGVIHRDISPDNIIQRSSDQRPVLIDFGGVKQIAVEAESQFVSVVSPPDLATRLGKYGYAPAEQMQQGVVSPQSDLYALAVTALVLLTGQDPVDLVRAEQESWQHQLTPHLASILMRMLNPQPGNRYSSAQAVLQALYASTDADVNPATLPTVAPGSPPSTGMTATSTVTAAPTSSAKGGKGWLLLLLLLLLGGMGWWTRILWLPWLHHLPWLYQSIAEQVPHEPSRETTFQTRRQQLGIPDGFLVSLTNETFYQRYPDQQGRTLSDSEADRQWRNTWYDIANNWLTILEANLSPEARRSLGSYTQTNRDAWKKAVNQLYVGSRSLFDLTDAKFFHLFPDWRGQEFLDKPIGQVWQGMVADQVAAIQAGKTLQEVKFDPGSFSRQLSHTLNPGEGRIYIANLTEGQILRVGLQAPADSTGLSIYVPRPTSELPSLLEDSADTTWNGRLTQSGYYEMTIVNRLDTPIAYQLNLAVDNVTSTPIEPPKPEAPQAKD